MAEAAPAPATYTLYEARKKIHPLEVKGKFRYLFIIRGLRLVPIRRRLRDLLYQIRRPRGVEAFVDMDAVNTL